MALGGNLRDARVVDEQGVDEQCSDKESSKDFRRNRTPSIPGGWDASDEETGLRYRRISSPSLEAPCHCTPPKLPQKGGGEFNAMRASWTSRTWTSRERAGRAEKKTRCSRDRTVSKGKGRRAPS